MAGPPVRQRYNAKARGSVAGAGSHKKRKRGPSRAADGEDGAQTDEVEGGVGAGMSSKKKKRLESYIAKKLKSEERLKTLQLLASLAPDAGTSAGLLSSSTLGQNPFAPTSAKERFEKKEDRVVRKEMSRLRRRGLRSSDEDEAGEDSGSDDGFVPRNVRKDVVRMDKGKGRALEHQPAVAEEEQSLGVISRGNKEGKRKSRKSKAAKWNPAMLSTQPQSDLSDFDSSASEGESTPEMQDEEAVAGPSRSASPIVSAPTNVETARKPAMPMSVGGALKRGVDGVAVQPRVVVRRIKGSDDAILPDEDSDDDEGEDEDADESASLEDGDDDEGTSSDEDEDEDATVDDSLENSPEPLPPPKKRALGFKDWALKQMGQAASSSASLAPPSSSNPTLKAKPKDIALPTGPHFGPLGETLSIPSSSLLDGTARKPSRARPTITRRPSVAAARMELPILAEEQPIVEAIRMHPVVVICGETGSGKTTQVPQMLYEAGFGFSGGDDPGMIAVTQPRRVAAVSLAARVRDELGFQPTSAKVAHQIRYSSTTSSETAIKFMTDGVLLRELAGDFLLSRYSVIIVDEAHERGVNTDVLIGVLSRVAKLREKRWREHLSDSAPSANGEAKTPKIKPLRIVIMSATLRIHDFTENPTLFRTPPPVIHIGARQHPVTVHFSRRTVPDYPSEAFKKVCKIHARLPPGGILVFMTGQAEIQAMCRKLEKKYGNAKSAAGQNGRSNGAHGKAKPITADPSHELPPEEQEAEDVELGHDEDLAADVDDGDALSDQDALDTDDEDDQGFDMDDQEDSPMPMHVLPLYSLLSHDQQMAVFKPPPSDHRLVIVATNVAETSLTIPGIRYVIDTGRAKERGYDHTSGVQSFSVSWISKASAAQRAGRAGRTGPGHCYRLYSSALFEDHFKQFSDPEILRMSIEGVVLQMKAMAIDQVVNFPFPTPPDRQALRKAEKLLTSLGALSAPTASQLVNGVPVAGTGGGQITDLGRSMANYPVSPRFAKMLVIGNQHACLPYIIAIVASLSVGDPFIHEQSLELDPEVDDSDDSDAEGRQRELDGIRKEEIRAREDRKELRRKYFKAQSVFTALGGGTTDMFKMLSAIGAYEFDPTPAFCSRSFLRLKAMQEIAQLRRQISTIAKAPLAPLTPPNDTQLKVIRQILTAGFIDQLAVRVDIAMKKGGGNFTSCRNVTYRASGVGSEDIYIHPSSSLFHSPPPDWVTWTEITRSQSRGEGLGKAWMKGVTTINPAWIATLGKDMCSWSRPMELPGKKTITKGEEREVVLVPHLRELAVDLPAVKRKQRREGTRWVLVE